MFEIHIEDGHVRLLNTEFDKLGKTSLLLKDNSSKEYFRVPNLTRHHDDMFSFIDRGEDAITMIRMGLGDETFAPEAQVGFCQVVYYLDRDYGRQKAAAYLMRNTNTLFRYFIKFGHEYYSHDEQNIGQQRPENPEYGYSNEFAIIRRIAKLKEMGNVYDNNQKYTNLGWEILHASKNDPDWREYLKYVQVPFRAEIVAKG